LDIKLVKIKRKENMENALVLKYHEIKDSVDGLDTATVGDQLESVISDYLKCAKSIGRGD
jgi:hypothetical protein